MPNANCVSIVSLSARCIETYDNDHTRTEISLRSSLGEGLVVQAAYSTRQIKTWTRRRAGKMNH